jgi:ornithine cyclodeaminase
MNRRTLKVAATDDLQRAVNGAHVICCATLATEPLLLGHWLPLGVHIDLVGAFTPEMREADDETLRRARVFVDTREGALTEAGDLMHAIAAGAMSEDDIAGDLFELTRGSRAGRRFHDQITVFKSVGAALEDLAAAKLALDTIVN